MEKYTIEALIRFVAEHTGCLPGDYLVYLCLTPGLNNGQMVAFRKRIPLSSSLKGTYKRNGNGQNT
ncbi:hypothetical protein [Niabella drilacis]|uniref:hypothetical protein n=1 Tax=Niabella drilacis (strain DSM 25811 / CCM 8410 / CCUG 62505 / LMG 26954 / E90) TaxID=1285928 RepID=UPI000B87EAAF|nr:hypothetical protein [Niabella drilacis]